MTCCRDAQNGGPLEKHFFPWALKVRLHFQMLYNLRKLRRRGMLSIAFPSEVFHKRMCVAGSRARTPDPKLVAQKGSPACRGFPNGSLLPPVAPPSDGCVIHPVSMVRKLSTRPSLSTSSTRSLRSFRSVAPIRREMLRTHRG